MTRPAALVFPDNLAALAICRELGSAGISTIVLGSTGRGPAAHSRFSHFVSSPDIYREPRRWVEFTTALARDLRAPAVLFATEDASLLVAEEYYEVLSAHFLYSWAAPSVVQKLLDKSVLYTLAAAAGIAVPRHHVVQDANGLSPCTEGRWIAKPFCRYRLEEDRIHSFLQVSGGNKALSGDPAQAIHRLLAAGFPAILQEELPGPAEDLISVGLCMSARGEVLSSFTSRKLCQYPEPFGDGLIVEPIADPGVTEIAVRLLREVGYWGICDVEFKRDSRDGVFKLLDANPRGWLWMGLGTAGGHYLARNAYQTATGGTEFRAQPSAASLREWVSGRGAVAFLLRCYRPRAHGVRLAARLLKGSLNTAAYNWRRFRDPLYLKPSAWGSIAADLAHARFGRQNAAALPPSPELGARGTASVAEGK